MPPAPIPPADDQIDLDRLLREAIFSVAVQAYSRGIGISTHVDSRLPIRVQGNAKEINGFLKPRTIKAGGTNTLAVALWFDKSGPKDQDPRILLEICRAIPEGKRLSTSLADLWTLPIGGKNSRPVCDRQPEASEAVIIPPPCTADSDAPAMVKKWIDAFRNRYLLAVPGAILNKERTVASFAAAGLERVSAPTPDRALAIARIQAETDRAVDFLVLEAQSLGTAAIELARAFRAEPLLSRTQIVLTGYTRDVDLSDNDAALIDALQQVTLPWCRLMQLLYDLSIAREQIPTRRQQGTTKTDGIPSLEGRRILIAEDVETNQMLLQTVLAPTGAEVEVVSDGAGVVKRQAEAPADLILMDLQMPCMGGIEAMRRLRALGGAAAGAKVIALTS